MCNTVCHTYFFCTTKMLICDFLTWNRQVMHSEWFLEQPDDFEQNWLLMPCPIGKRVLVTSSQVPNFSLLIFSAVAHCALLWCRTPSRFAWGTHSFHNNQFIQLITFPTDRDARRCAHVWGNSSNSSARIFQAARPTLTTVCLFCSVIDHSCEMCSLLNLNIDCELKKVLTNQWIGCAELDCVFEEATNTFFCLDLMKYNLLELEDCEVYYLRLHFSFFCCTFGLLSFL